MAGRRPFGGSTINDAWRCGGPLEPVPWWRLPPPTTPKGTFAFEVEVGNVLILLALGLRHAGGEFIGRVARAEDSARCSGMPEATARPLAFEVGITACAAW